AKVAELSGSLSGLPKGVSRLSLGGEARTALAVPVKGLAAASTLVVLAGPFTPGFGADETARMQQLMSAFITALDRRHLIAELERANLSPQEAKKHQNGFLAHMNQELRPPPNPILRFSQHLSHAREGQFDEATRRRFLGQILTSGKHLLGLINDILDLSKVEAGQMELRLQTVSLAESVDQVVRTVEPLVGKKAIRLEAH